MNRRRVEDVEAYEKSKREVSNACPKERGPDRWRGAEPQWRDNRRLYLSNPTAPRDQTFMTRFELALAGHDL